jgi:TolA-binding protein
MNRKQREGVWALVLALGTAGAMGCSREQGDARFPADGPGRTTEREARQDFIADTEHRIDALEDRINSLQARIQSEGVSATEQASWREELRTLEQEKERARAHLSEARAAGAHEWRVFQNDLSIQVDRLESSVETLAARVASRESERTGDDADFTDEEREPVGGEDELPDPGPDVHEDYRLEP